ncbi:MAG TPA: hypothetical protein V6D23_28500, partial [Candidatus Obscuribacterales bacterium]
MYSHFIELPLLAELFRLLQEWRGFSSFRWLIFSRQHAPELIRTPLDEDTVLFYMSNEDGVLPDFYSQLRCVFTPDLKLELAAPRVHLIPLGCNGDVPEVPWIPWPQRQLDVFFSGQVLPRRSAFIMQAIQLLFDLQPHLELQAQIQLTPRFRTGMDPETYSRTLMNSRIALIPPGFSPITLRMFEAMRCGCLLVTCDMPDFWYLHGLPRLVMPLSWEGLSDQVLAILENQEMQLKLHAQTQKHYLGHCTPQAIVRFIKNQLDPP